MTQAPSPRREALRHRRVRCAREWGPFTRAAWEREAPRSQRRGFRVPPTTTTRATRKVVVSEHRSRSTSIGPIFGRDIAAAEGIDAAVAWMRSCGATRTDVRILGLSPDAEGWLYWALRP